jgi:ADP-heptose:LPS heptosyltransferase/GT2 family glycosyltransferase
MSAPPSLLVVKVDTLGDLVLFAPALRALRAGWPATRLAVVIRRTYLDLARLLEPGVDWIATSLDPFNRSPADDPAELDRIRALVTELRPAAVVAATSRRNWLEFALAAAAPPDARRIALGAEAADEFFQTQLQVQLGLASTGAFSEIVAPPADEPDWRRSLRLASALLGHAVPDTAPSFSPATPDATALLADLGLTPGRYAVCAAAGFANVRLKTWPADRFAAVIAHLRKRHGLPTLLIGHESERAHLAAIPGAAAVWTGRDGELPLLASLLAPAALFVGNDTGAMHLAAAVDVPVVGIFGGGTWPRFVPAARRGVAVVHPLPCFGCGWDCAFGDAPCLGEISVGDVTAAVDQALAAPAFAVQSVDRLSAETRRFIAQAAARYRDSRAGHLARQHKLEEITALDREKDAAIAEKEAEIATKEAEIAALKTVCDEREKTIFVLDGHVRHFQTENNTLRADKAIHDQTLAALPADAAKAAQTIADQLIHIRNIESILRHRENELGELKRTAENRGAGLHDLENAKIYGRQLAEKEAVIQALSQGIAQRDAIVAQLGAEITTPTAKLRLLAQALALRWREKIAAPFDAWLFRRVVEQHWMQIGVLRQYAPRPLVWDHALPGPRRPDDSLPQIAIVTPSYGQEQFLERTMRSVLDQSYPKLLYVVQDGGSKDRSPEIIARHAARLRHWESAPDRGQADAVHRGFTRVAPDLRPDDVMAWLNSDDLLAPGALRCVGEYFAAHPEVDLIYGHRIIIDDDDRDVGRWIMPRHDPATLEWIDYVPQETMFWRKRAWDRAGGIDPTFQFALDWDLLARVQQSGGKLVRVPWFLGAFRVHHEQKTAQAIHTTGAEEMRRIRTRFHGARENDGATIERYARHARFWGAITSRLHALGLRW